MSLYLFNFVYNTLMQKVNNNTPGNSLFLPAALSDMTDDNGKPYLPLKENQWSIENIAGAVDISNDLATTWFGALYSKLDDLKKEKPNGSITQNEIDAAAAAVKYITDNKYAVVTYPNVGPDLVAENIEIDGLANIRIKGGEPKVISDEKGYTTDIDLIPNAWKDQKGDWDVPLSLGGEVAAIDSHSGKNFKGLSFTLDQMICFYDRQKEEIVAPPPTLKLKTSDTYGNGFISSTTGVALMGLTEGEVSTNSTVTVTTPPALNFNVNSVKLIGTKSTDPKITLDNLQYNSIDPNPFPNYIDKSSFFSVWTEFFQRLLNTGEAASMITNKVNATLLDPNNRTQISNLLNSQVSNALDTVYDSTAVACHSVSGNVNDVDEYIFNRARGALNDKTSSRYVPALILSSTSPTLDPFEATDLDVSGSFSTSVVGQNIQISDIKLSDLVINGISNTVALPENVVFGDNQQATATLLLGEVPSGTQVKIDNKMVTVPSPPVKASSPFSLNIQVNTNEPVPIAGTLTINVTNKSGTAGLKNVLTATGDTPEQLKLIFNEINIQTDPSDVTLGLDLPPDAQQYEIFLHSFLNQPDLINAIINAINGYIPQELDQISKTLTEFAKKALNSIGS